MYIYFTVKMTKKIVRTEYDPVCKFGIAHVEKRVEKGVYSHDLAPSAWQREAQQITERVCRGKGTALVAVHTATHTGLTRLGPLTLVRPVLGWAQPGPSLGPGGARQEPGQRSKTQKVV